MTRLQNGHALSALNVRAVGGGVINFRDVLNAEDQVRFEQLMFPHLDAAFNLAVWLLGNRTAAEDIVQEGLLCSYRFFPPFQGTEARVWLLQFVHNGCYTWLSKNRPAEDRKEFDEDLHSSANPTREGLATFGEDLERLTRELETLSPQFRELIVLRELERCSYREIAAIMSIPTDRVMFQLARARRQLQLALAKPISAETTL